MGFAKTSASTGAGSAGFHADAAKEAAYTQQRERYWDDFALSYGRWERFRRHYQQRLAEIYRFLIPPGRRVLELGSGVGDLLASLKPSYGVGLDISGKMIDLAQQRHPELHFVHGDAHRLDLGETFDYIIGADFVNDVWDVQQVFRQAHRYSEAHTRIIVNAYSSLWQLPRRLAESVGIAKWQLPQNWLTAADIHDLLYLAEFETVRAFSEILCPFWIPLLSALANRYAAKLLPFRLFALTNFVVARPTPNPQARSDVRVSVVVAARNEEQNIPLIFNRVPRMGRGTELIFIEGGSHDDTYGAIEREISLRPGVDAKLYKQSGNGKGDAVRLGFAHASGDVLMILDADLTVAPEDLPHFYEAWRSGRAEFVNGVRLVYPMEAHAMRFWNLVGNKFFSLAFSWLLDQSIKDTLCGTKVLSRRDYEMIAANRSYFGDFDPFGDFDLLFGAAKYNLKIVDLPLRYGERVYGETNIQRWRHGVLLLRMALFALRRIKFV